MTIVTVMIMVMMLTVLMMTLMMMLTCPRSGSLGSGLHTDSWLPKLQIQRVIVVSSLPSSVSPLFMVQVHKLSIHLLVRSSSVIPWDEGESVVATIPRFALTPSARNAFYLILILLFVSFLSSLAPASHHIFLHPSQPLSATLQTFFSFSLPHFLPPAPITTLMCSFNPFSLFESLSHPTH